MENWRITKEDVIIAFDQNNFLVCLKFLLPPENITRKETKLVSFCRLATRLLLNSRVKYKTSFDFFYVMFYCVVQKHETKYTRKYCTVFVLRKQHYNFARLINKPLTPLFLICLLYQWTNTKRNIYCPNKQFEFSSSTLSNFICINLMQWCRICTFWVLFRTNLHFIWCKGLNKKYVVFNLWRACLDWKWK